MNEKAGYRIRPKHIRKFHRRLTGKGPKVCPVFSYRSQLRTLDFEQKRSSFIGKIPRRSRLKTDSDCVKLISDIVAETHEINHQEKVISC